jgi:hypothetical protein
MLTDNERELLTEIRDLIGEDADVLDGVDGPRCSRDLRMVQRVDEWLDRDIRDKLKASLGGVERGAGPTVGVAHRRLSAVPPPTTRTALIYHGPGGTFECDHLPEGAVVIVTDCEQVPATRHQWWRDGDKIVHEVKPGGAQ